MALRQPPLSRSLGAPVLPLAPSGELLACNPCSISGVTPLWCGNKLQLLCFRAQVSRSLLGNPSLVDGSVGGRLTFVQLASATPNTTFWANTQPSSLPVSQGGSCGPRGSLVLRALSSGRSPRPHPCGFPTRGGRFAPGSWPPSAEKWVPRSAPGRPVGV